MIEPETKLNPKSLYLPLEDGQQPEMPIPDCMTLLSAFEWLFNASLGTCLSDEFMTKAQPATDYIRAILEITPRQAAILSIFIAECVENGHCDAKDISGHLGCNPYSTIVIRDELDQLRRLHMLSKNGGIRYGGYTVSNELMEAIRENRAMPKRVIENLSFENMFAELRYIIRTACDDTCPGDICIKDICSDIRNLFSHNQHLDFCKNAEIAVDSGDVNFFTFVYYCSHLVNMDHDYMVLNKTALHNVLNEWEYNRLERTLMSGDNVLITHGLLESYTDTGLYDYAFRVTDNVRKSMLSEYVPIVITRRDGMLKPEKIIPKQLFYNPETQQQMDTIEKLLSQGNYHTAVESLEKSGMRRGVAILLSGPAGTGKTEFVLQLARKTGRSIMQVNVSDIKDKFVGESEKRCNAMWNEYNRFVEKSSVEPILFLNEADQILGRRFENVDHSSDQMNNSLQNIMLENMEKTNGIMICTTNLAKNLDSAFERRFLFKVELDRPTIEARREIWKSLVPQISEEHATFLAAKYDLSGGQVENISRKLLISAAVDNLTDISLEHYCKFCEQELCGYTKNPVGKIGF